MSTIWYDSLNNVSRDQVRQLWIESRSTHLLVKRENSLTLEILLSTPESWLPYLMPQASTLTLPASLVHCLIRSHTLSLSHCLTPPIPQIRPDEAQGGGLAERLTPRLREGGGNGILPEKVLCINEIRSD